MAGTFDQRKEEILEAAISVFAREGYQSVTTADVAREAGISQPYIYRFFPSKEALFEAVVDRIYGRILDAFRSVPQGPDFERRLISRYEDLMHTHPREIRLQVQTWGIVDPAIESSVASALLRLKTLVTEAFIADGSAGAEEKAEEFLARGLLCNLATVLELPELYRSKS